MSWSGCHQRESSDSLPAGEWMGLHSSSASCLVWGILVLVPIDWWVVLSLDANKLEGRLQNDAASTSVHILERTFQYGCHYCLCPQDDLQLPPALLGGSPRRTDMSHPHLFQIMLLSWVLECVIFCVSSLRVESLFFIALWISQNKLYWPSKPNVLGLILPWRTWDRIPVCTHCCLGRPSAAVIILLFVGCPHGGMGLDYTVTLPLLCVSLCVCFFFF